MTSNKSSDEFREIALCGGQFTVNVRTIDGKVGASFGVRHSNPVPATWFAIYALDQGIPVSMIRMGGLGDPWPVPPLPRCFPVFVASDSERMFGQQCPDCRGYWRTDRGPSGSWSTICPYCGARAPGYTFLMEGQRAYVTSFCRLVVEALASGMDGQRIVDMDQIAKTVGSSHEKPSFYYAEISQQKKFTCVACEAMIDILGRYGFCSSCGTHNGIGELTADLLSVRISLEGGADPISGLKQAVSSFDSYAGKIADHLTNAVPMTARRRRQWERKLFHNLGNVAKDFLTSFDIDIFNSLDQSDIDFCKLMFYRRHVHEHNGGEADERYIQDSGDISVKPKQLLRESKGGVLRLIETIARVSGNLHSGFHEIIPVQISTIPPRRGGQR